MVAPRRERKVVTVVFCDLVGFTSRAEELDPEDVEAILRPYYTRLRAELERHGGTVEKFIGDAMMALCGAPSNMRTIPSAPCARRSQSATSWSRAARAPGRDHDRRGPRLARRLPSEGEGMASGDVNTAARLQSAAPGNGILADETTYRSIRQTIEYRGAAPVEAKGKAEPITVWEAIAA